MFFKQKKKKKILIVDDDDGMRGLLHAILHDDYDILEAIDGRAGLASALKHIPDLIIMDIMMPELTGLAAVGFIRDSKTIKHIPIMMLTAMSKVSDIEKSLNAGANDYLVKPFDIPQLTSKIKKLLKNSRP